MKISDHIKNSIEASDSRDFDKAMLFACLAIDGTAKKMYPDIDKVGERYRRFIREYIDVIEIMFGGLDLRETYFPFKNSRGKIGVKFEDIVYERFRCSLAHGEELSDGFGVSVKIAEGRQQFIVDIENLSMTFPESSIYALGLACVLAPVNSGQKIGSNLYYYKDPINTYVVDRWWGKIDCARGIMDFENLVKVKVDFSEVWPAE